MLRAHGRFLDDYRQAPIKIVNHVSRQLGLAPVLFLDRPGRAQTEREQSLRIRRYLGVRGFDRQAVADLREWLRQGAIQPDTKQFGHRRTRYTLIRSTSSRLISSRRRS